MDKESVVQVCNAVLLSRKRNEIMPFAATWIDPEIIILREIGQIGKDIYHMVSLICEVLFLKIDK